MLLMRKALSALARKHGGDGLDQRRIGQSVRVHHALDPLGAHGTHAIFFGNVYRGRASGPLGIARSVGSPQQIAGIHEFEFLHARWRKTHHFQRNAPTHGVAGQQQHRVSG